MKERDHDLRFERIREGSIVEAHEFERDVVKIGRLPSSHLQLDEEGVSRIHAVVERSGSGTYSVVDLGSAEGTYVNGDAVSKSELSEGDVLRFGESRLRVRMVDAIASESVSDGAGAAAANPGEGDDADSPTRDERRPSDRQAYTRAFFEDRGGATLEVAHLWGDHLLSVESFERGESVTMGPGEEPDFQVGASIVDAPRTPLVRFDGEYRLVLTGEMSGSIWWEGESWDVRDLVRERTSKAPGVPGRRVVALDSRTSARIEIGEHTFLLHFTTMPASVGTSLSFDGEALPYQGMSAAAHVLLLLLCMGLPGEVGAMSLAEHSQENRFVEMMVKPQQKEEREQPKWMKSGGEKAAQHPGKEGKAGKENAEHENKQMAIEGPPDNEETKIAKERDRDVAMKAGLMKTLRQDRVASKWGSSSQSIGGDAINALGNLQGAKKGVASGFHGMGVHGAGHGGGCSGSGCSETGLGIGPVGEGIGGGGGPGGPGYGEGKQNLGDNDEEVPDGGTVVPQPPTSGGGLDKKIIRKVVRQHRRELKYCYEKQLAVDPNLEGQVTVRFTISPNGEVIAAVVTGSTLGSAAVEQCVTGKIQRWTFPDPRGGQVVEVNYPFNFAPSR